MLSYFLLVGITDVTISVPAEFHDYIRSLDLSQYGFNISFLPESGYNTMIVYDKALIFGANLTRWFLMMMSREENIIPVCDNIELPVIFAHHLTDIGVLKKISERKKLGRGVINIPLSDSNSLKDASEFVKIYQKYQKLKISDLSEIAENRGTTAQK